MAVKPKVGVLVMALLQDDYNMTAHMRPVAQKAADRIGNILAVVGVHSDDAPDAHDPIRAGITILSTFDETALIDADITQLPEGFIHDFEDHRHQRCVRISGQRDLGALVVVVAGEAGTVQGAGQKIADRIHQRLNAFVLERCAAKHRHALVSQRDSS